MLLPGDQKKHMPTAVELINNLVNRIDELNSIGSELLQRINRLEENQKLIFSSVMDLQNRVSLLEGENESTTSGS